MFHVFHVFHVFRVFHVFPSSEPPKIKRNTTVYNVQPTAIHAGYESALVFIWVVFLQFEFWRHSVPRTVLCNLAELESLLKFIYL